MITQVMYNTLPKILYIIILHYIKFMIYINLLLKFMVINNLNL